MRFSDNHMWSFSFICVRLLQESSFAFFLCNCDCLNVFLADGMFGCVDQDLSDTQWRNFRSGLPALIAVMAAFSILGACLRGSLGLKGRGMARFWLIASSVYVIYLHGNWYIPAPAIVVLQHTGHHVCLGGKWWDLASLSSYWLVPLYVVVWLGSVLFILAIALGNYVLTKVLLFLYLLTSCTLFFSQIVLGALT
jgi:hypothetical protein